MATLNLPNILENATAADAVELEQNNTYLETFVNTQLIHRDGAVAMTAQLHLVGDPVAEDDAARKAYVDAILPVGIILPYGGVTAPAGRWAICNGALLNTAEYPELFAVFQYKYGGAGAQFALPDLRSRTVFGYNTGDTDFNTVGKTGGTKSVPLLQHSHTMTHGHTASSGTVSSDHTHPFSGTTSIETAQHNHSNWAGGNFLAGYDTGSPLWILANGVDQAVWQAPTSHWENQNHQHTFSGSTGGISTNHSHAITVNNFTGSTSTDGTAAATMIPQYLTLPFITRTD